MGKFSVLLYVFVFQMVFFSVVNVCDFFVLNFICNFSISVGLLSLLDTPCLFARDHSCCSESLSSLDCLRRFFGVFAMWMFMSR
jgi:hypothetical protein